MWDRRAAGEVAAPENWTPPAPCAPKHCAPGPGTHLKGIFLELGFAACPICNGRAAQMDEWGVEGCREHFDEIVEWLREAAARLGLLDRLKLVAKTVTSGWMLRLNWADPIPSLVEEAIRRAE